MSLTKKERDAIPAESFAGPHRSFPVDTPAHAKAAARLAGHADNPSAVRANIKALDKKQGFTPPKAWSSQGKPARMNIPKTPNPLHDPKGYRKAMDNAALSVHAMMKCAACGAKAMAKRCPKCGSTQMHKVPAKSAAPPMRKVALDPDRDHDYR